jgi:small multidrug resistance family-3 protein
MFNTLQRIPIPLLLILATTLEVSGDALVRLGIYQYAGPLRVACFLGGAVLLFGYGSALNTAPVEFARIVGLYIATLFVVWQIISFLAFKSLPGLPILLGGALIVAGGLLITFWHTPA